MGLLDKDCKIFSQGSINKSSEVLGETTQRNIGTTIKQPQLNKCYKTNKEENTKEYFRNAGEGIMY